MVERRGGATLHTRILIGNSSFLDWIHVFSIQMDRFLRADRVAEVPQPEHKVLRNKMLLATRDGVILIA